MKVFHKNGLTENDKLAIEPLNHFQINKNQIFLNHPSDLIDMKTEKI